ncbi:hypothetical protein [Mycobacteroides salmoniphilum]|uniref:Uncharacterized protein n=1 Tax=Mycobacteroides salmoniphilum TaxID=404941 RepID=A0A4R8T030_9MYCO|nr:hypothetical protein [Mycobacteroides salmoniphilum]TEA09106.1 hypothetical protein CCUG60884_00275 [Mycobacteroides salmoniphilum]
MGRPNFDHVDPWPYMLRHWYDTTGWGAVDYCALSVKQRPDRQCIAIRTSLDTDDENEWLLIDSAGGVRRCRHETVATWVDLKPPPSDTSEQFESEVDHAVRVLASASRYSVRDNQTGQWVA